MIEILIVTALVLWSMLVVFKRCFRTPLAQSSEAVRCLCGQGLAASG